MGDPVLPTATSMPERTPTGRALPVTLIRSIAFKFGVVGFNALTGIVTARALHPTGRGELAALVLWPVLFAGLTTLGLPSALIYHMKRSPERRSSLLGWALVLAGGTGVVGTVLGWLLVPLWLTQHPPHVIEAARYCLLGTIVSSLTLVGRAAWEADGRFDLSNISQLIAPVLIILALLVQAGLGTLTPRAAAFTYVLAGLPMLTWILWSLGRGYGLVLSAPRESSSRLLNFGLRSYGVDLCGQLSHYVDQALVVGLLSPAAMGIYVVALSVSRIINAVHASVAMIMFPRTVGLPPDALATATARAARLGSIVAAGGGLLVVIAGPLLVQLVYGRSFAPAGYLLPVLVVEVVLAGLAHVLMQGFMAAGRPGIATVVQLGGLAVSVPIFLLWVPPFGAMGAAAALVASTAIRLGFALVAYRFLLHVAMPRVWIARRDLVDLAAYRGALFEYFARLRTGEVK